MTNEHQPTTNASRELRLEMPARLDFDAARKLIDHATQLPGGTKYSKLCLDFRKTLHLDTAGLGSLLVIAEHFGAETLIQIEGAAGVVRELLMMASPDPGPARPGQPARQARFLLA
jgi:anti-anti-sigma regulatory factor